jgi:hypothetical protein
MPAATISRSSSGKGVDTPILMSDTENNFQDQLE